MRGRLMLSRPILVRFAYGGFKRLVVEQRRYKPIWRGRIIRWADMIG